MTDKIEFQGEIGSLEKENLSAKSNVPLLDGYPYSYNARKAYLMSRKRPTNKKMTLRYSARVPGPASVVYEWTFVATRGKNGFRHDV